MPVKRSTTARGYGADHQAERRRLKPKVERGEIDCTRCGEPIEPGEPWDLGHTDDRTGWTGPEHAACNRRDGANKTNGTTAPAVYVPSIDW